MNAGLWGKKIGMTQVFDGDIVVPVTAIDVTGWIVFGFKTVERDGYNALIIGLVKDRYASQSFTKEWTKSSKRYFSVVREVKTSQDASSFVLGEKIAFHKDLEIGSEVDVFALTKGCGFAGVVRRHGFTGGKASHGSTMGKRPGSMGGARMQGKIIKGKKLPGHMGVVQRMMSGLKVIRVVEKNDQPVVLVKGSVPGKAGSLVYIRKAS